VKQNVSQMPYAPKFERERENKQMNETGIAIKKRSLVAT
jgi:hypothetical protein